MTVPFFRNDWSGPLEKSSSDQNVLRGEQLPLLNDESVAVLNGNEALNEAGRLYTIVSQPTRLYFIGCDGTDAVKIGVTNEINQRLASLQAGCPLKLAVLAICDGTVELERELHAQFRASRIHREWFHRSPELDALIDSVAGGGQIPRRRRSHVRRSGPTKRGGFRVARPPLLVFEVPVK